MKIKILASGSSGNCTFVEMNSTRFLIDVGISSKMVVAKLKQNEICPTTIDFVLITHCHEDHIKGLVNFVKRFNPKVYFSRELITNKNFIMLQEETYFNQIKLTAFKTSHDIDESYGYILEYQDESLVYLTDTGYINQTIKNKIKNKTAYIMESNHDVPMLMNTTRPYDLKMRILGDRGHLSNETSVKCLGEIVGNNTKKIFLVHLSEEANTPEQVMRVAQAKGIKVPVTIASRDGCGLIEV